MPSLVSILGTPQTSDFLSIVTGPPPEIHLSALD